MMMQIVFSFLLNRKKSSEELENPEDVTYNRVEPWKNINNNENQSSSHKSADLKR